MGARIAMMRLGRKTEGITCLELDFTKDLEGSAGGRCQQPGA
jgi:hypothetical protein